MKKKIFLRCLFGIPVGLTISTIITIMISLTVGDGNFYPVVPELTANCGSEINAMLLQTICSLLYGAAWAGASTIWEKESWSMLHQTVAHLIVCSVSTFPIAYFMRWIPHNTIGILLYFNIFFGIYVIIWLSQYTAIKRRVQQINEKIKNNNFENK